MELPPNPGGDKGFISEGADVLHGKRKSTLTDVESVKAQRLQSVASRSTEDRRQFHARRAGTPEPRAKFGNQNFDEAPGDDLRRWDVLDLPRIYRHPSFYVGPGPYWQEHVNQQTAMGHPTDQMIRTYLAQRRSGAHASAARDTSCVIS